MTPFDSSALLAMLLAFYPAVSPAAFARARAERPEYFAGGKIIGSKGDKLQLPDARVFDCIFASGGPLSGQRWQMLEVVDDPNAPVDPFALEDGPLVPLDVPDPDAVPGDTTFEDLVSSHLGALDGADTALQGGADAMVNYDGADGLDAAYENTIGPAVEANAAYGGGIDAGDPSSLQETAAEHSGAIDSQTSQYDDQPPDDLPVVDPGDPPDTKGGEDNPPPKE